MRLLLVFLFISSTWAQLPDHTLFSPVLEDLLNDKGLVDYQKLSTHREPLINYLNELITHPPGKDWSEEEVMAYWINSYNAFTLKLIADHYPVKSIRAISNPWTREFIPWNGRQISLDYMEHQILRKMNDPRIHFAINCASVSCPVLLEKPYLGKSLNVQLDQAAFNFINDKERNHITPDQLHLSKIFKWFRKDFTGEGSLLKFISDYSSVDIHPGAGIDYLEYNWDLNEQ